MYDEKNSINNHIFSSSSTTAVTSLERNCLLSARAMSEGEANNFQQHKEREKEILYYYFHCPDLFACVVVLASLPGDDKIWQLHFVGFYQYLLLLKVINKFSSLVVYLYFLYHFEANVYTFPPLPHSSMLDALGE